MEWERTFLCPFEIIFDDQLLVLNRHSDLISFSQFTDILIRFVLKYKIAIVNPVLKANGKCNKMKWFFLQQFCEAFPIICTRMDSIAH